MSKYTFIYKREKKIVSNCSWFNENVIEFGGKRETKKNFLLCCKSKWVTWVSLFISLFFFFKWFSFIYISKNCRLLTNDIIKVNRYNHDWANVCCRFDREFAHTRTRTHKFEGECHKTKTLCTVHTCYFSTTHTFIHTHNGYTIVVVVHSEEEEIGKKIYVKLRSTKCFVTRNQVTQIWTDDRYLYTWNSIRSAHTYAHHASQPYLTHRICVHTHIFTCSFYNTKGANNNITRICQT